MLFTHIHLLSIIIYYKLRHGMALYTEWCAVLTLRVPVAATRTSTTESECHSRLPSATRRVDSLFLLTCQGH